MELIWDFYREGAADTATAIGATVHYYDQQSQSIFVNNGLWSKEAKVTQGQWETAERTAAHKITEDSYNQLELDHASNGVWYGTAIDGDDLYLLRYLYAKDLSDFTESVTWESQNDNEIKQMNANIMNTDEATFKASNTLFNPNARLQLYLTVGDSSPYTIGTAYVDDIDYNLESDTVYVSGRNTIGALLNDQTFDTNNSFSGLSHTIFAAILDLAGITDYVIQDGTGNAPFTFDYNKTLLAGLQEMFEFYFTWKMTETPDGQIIIGNAENFISQYVKNGYYTFNGGKEVFTRKTVKASDAAYSRVCVRCPDTVDSEDAEGNKISVEKYPPVVAEVPTYTGWELPARKTYHIDAPEGMTQTELQDYAEQLAKELQYTGISETFTSPIRPWLLVGDIASVYYTGETQAANLGIITSVKHTLGRNGFTTEFTVDSGGDATDADAFTVTTNRAVKGYTRKLKLTDIIKALIKR